ncbi:hypothetical protein II5_03078 [Bacillus cereus MSX-A1]|uniref:hypothetical protein n=1 Tax=Bacillus cereus TaxID=1396 RepID=UPI0002795342|nr:hypothetical protein [Bacillus cereus]EJR05088.1 hypothetical protein II5_03078 [Bacillus cereus MSX-A1]MDR4292029.1 hypothetical protein [Bacillus cereus]PES69807.1 hypothetical protein CN512_10795 [Bacillus cereus]
MTVKEMYMEAKNDRVMSLIIVIESLLQYGKIKFNDCSTAINPYLLNNYGKWDKLIKNEMMKRGCYK